MAKDDGERFWSEVARSEPLQAELRAIAASDRDSALATIVAVAQRAGYTLTPDDVAASLQASRELDDQALDAVAGGASLGTVSSFTIARQVLSPSVYTVAGFTSVTGLDAETTVTEYRDGQDMPLRHKP